MNILAGKYIPGDNCLIFSREQGLAAAAVECRRPTEAEAEADCYLAGP